MFGLNLKKIIEKLGINLVRLALIYRGLRSRMPFPRNRKFPEKTGKFPISEVQEYPIPGPE